MDKKEAKKIIVEQLEQFRSKPFQELVKMIDDEPITYEFSCQNGTIYQIEIQAFWDDKPNGNVRVTGNIDNGGLRVFFPLTDSFIKSQVNNFVDE